MAIRSLHHIWFLHQSVIITMQTRLVVSIMTCIQENGGGRHRYTSVISPLILVTKNLRFEKIEEIGEPEERCYHSTYYHIL